MAEFKEFEDGEATERFAEEHPDAYMRRRDFLGRTAALAGLAGLAAALPTETLVSQAARMASRTPFPTPTQMQGKLDTVVVLMMENRSYDHYFGWLPGGDGRNSGLSYPDDANQLHPTHRLAPDFQGCAFHDPDHSVGGGRVQYNNGALDGFRRSPNDDFAIGYYLEQDIPFIPAAAKAFTLYDRYFCSLLGPTFPNRHYQWSAQSGGQTTNVIPADSSLGDHWENIFDRAVAQGVSVRYYSSDQPFALLYGVRALPWIRPVAEFYVDAALGQLPNICFVDPPFTDGGGGDGLSADEHPHGDIRLGQTFMAEIVNAFLRSPQFRTGAMFVNYDEWGGFFDHVSPRFVPDDRESPNLADTFGITGFRVPGVAISPYARRGYVSHAAVTHESILKLISYRFGLGFLNKRHRYASNIGRTFDWENPNFTPPTLPTPLPPVTLPCTLQNLPLSLPIKAPAGQQASTSSSTRTRRRTRASKEGVDLGSPEFTEYAHRLGYEVPKLKASEIFHTPKVIKRFHKIWGR